jgi:nuclear pore complex protein Nup98-Nup96
METNSLSSGFGASSNNATPSPFGQNKPAFGSTSTGGGLFGGGAATTTASTGFGGFGNTSTSAFGGGSNAGTFGAAANKPAFGASTGGGLFGSGSGSSAALSTGFGGAAAPATSGFGTASPFATNQQNTGTQNPPFTPFTEKEASTSITNHYQTITAMPAYNKFQVEELRFVDYAQGRKYGNQGGQAGAFGASTGFGGFGGNAQPAQNTGFGATTGTASGGLFGNTANSASTPFGGAQNTTSGFGASNSGGGLFGQQAKPAATNLFGNTTASSAPASGGLFGTSNTGFGAGNTTSAFGVSAGTSAFGQTQNKPLFGGGATTGFGANTGTGTSLFGGAAPNTGTAFGQTQQAAPAGGFAFGQQNNQQQQPQQAQAGGGLFGGFGNVNNQAKPAGGLFGSGNTAAGGNLFGQQQPAQQQQQQAGGLFGNSTQQQTGGLFGGNRPATTNLFGSSANTGGGGLFGGSNNQQQQQQQNAGGLFGSSNNQNNAGAFGARPGLATAGLGGGLFGQSANQPQASNNLFGSTQQPQQQGGLLGSSLFGSTQQQPMQQSQQPNHLVASLNDNPYGNYQLFASLNTPTQSPGPLATPLGPSSTTRKQAIIPHYRVVPHASSRLLTPQKRPQGFGFSYSNYNSPMSPASSTSPLGNSLLGGSSLLGRSLGKSLSTSNLRHSYSAQDSILAPGAFTTNRGGSGSMKKLNINRNLTQRRSLFANDAPATDLRKRVSFERDVTEGESSPNMSGALMSFEQREESPATAVSSPPAQQNGATGQELAIVPENSSLAATSAEAELRKQNSTARLYREDQTLGEYTMDPSIEQLRAMNRQQRSAVSNFTVQREGAGQIVFSLVDLNTVPIEQICGQIVELSTRQATVYGDKSPVRTPPQGEGLNVRSTITLENSWPRQKGGRLKVPDRKSVQFEKHIRILKSCKDTKFVNYDEASGRWTFEVEHYTTYGLTYDDDDSVMTTTISHDSPSPAAAKTASQHHQSDTTPELPQDESFTDSQGSGVDDTFDFKRPKRKHLPGEFDDQTLNEVDFMDEPLEETQHADLGIADDGMDMDPFLLAGEMDMQEPFHGHTVDWNIPEEIAGPVKSGIENFEQSAVAKPPSPQQTEQLWVGGDWTEHLQHTMSPMKRDRQALRVVQGDVISSISIPAFHPADEEKVAFGSTLDIMKSLFGQIGGQERAHPTEVRFAVPVA